MNDVLNEYDLIDLYVRHAVDAHPDDAYFNMHIHETCEIFYFISGNAEYIVEGSKYPLEKGSLLIMRPSESHRTRILGSRIYERYAMNFYPSVLDSIDPQHRLMKPFTDRPLGRGNIYSPSEFDGMNLDRIFQELFCCNGDDYDNRLRILTHLFELLHMINNVYLKRGASEYMPPQSLSEQIVAHVNAHLYDELSIPVLAEHFFLSASQFSRVFKQATGAAPWEYITKKRLTAAKEIIRNGISAQKACDICGFGDYSSFYRAYKKHFGNGPKIGLMRQDDA